MTTPETNGNRDDELSWSRGRLQPVDVCPACQAKGRQKVSYRRRDDSDSMPDIWCMVKCATCDSLYLDPRPDDESLPRAYEQYFTHTKTVETNVEKGMSGVLWRLICGYLNSVFGMNRHPAIRFGLIAFKCAGPWRQKLDHYCRNLYKSEFPDGGKLLDLGCGEGSFLERACEMGWDATGCEPDKRAVDVCKQAGLNVLHGDVFCRQLDDMQFDAITASHVIEHVPDIELVLQRVFSILKPGGMVWFAFPNPDCLTLKLYKSAAVILHIPYHICIPSQRQFSRMLKRAGFSEIRSVRRGIHSRSNWCSSNTIAAMQGLPKPAPVPAFAGRLFSDLLSLFSVRWGEESVFTARKNQEPANFS